MDGIVDELVRLEEEKRKALIKLDAGLYEHAVEAQTALLAKDLVALGPQDAQKLHVFSRLAALNTRLYENLLAFSPAGIETPARQYTGQGTTLNPPESARTFSAKA